MYIFKTILRITKKILIIILLFGSISISQTIDFRGQASGWAQAIHPVNSWQSNEGLRYLPEASFTQDLSPTLFWSALISTNLAATFTSSSQVMHLKLNLYRLQLRLATAQSETRLGLQKISFGPAQLLRSLQWFDSLDPKDPLSLTAGVYALRYRYTFLNNSNIWLWTLYGNSKKRRSDLFATSHNNPEWGGRFQTEIPNGSLAISGHFRTVNNGFFNYKETRYSLDGRWDWLIGFWLETALLQNTEARPIPKWQKRLTVGGDYTFGLGNGLYLLAEHQNISADNHLFNLERQTNTSAMMLSYPLNLLDNFRIIAYYSWDNKKF